ncbi:phosphoribosyl-AMP cyclohydrolase [Limisalsivibrio acetivorans]|uniref:phosphoribosyl-AMP cyclohydrolase n=1 Tax=Limisalsivibrio acetivorans TaxID=1304888 RepID=UPI00041B5A6E|nr:phosphoribosyl-AMP cyclohydrolase [Limisalsivibrio acetivorans]
MEVPQIDWVKQDGLLPVVVQDADTKDVLMLAYANEEALRLTKETGFAHYYSRSRKSLWKKGESSGNLQFVKSVALDCDGDTLLYVVNQKGAACHTGEWSCFYTNLYQGE